jgi:hypothetical protein
MSAPRPELAALRIADAPERWSDLGFTVEDDRIELGGVTITLGGAGTGITGWTLRNVDLGEIFDFSKANAARRLPKLDELATTVTTAAPAPSVPPGVHPNGATALDHVVILTPDFDSTAAKLAAAGMPLRRVRDAGGFRQGFRRLGPAIMEIVETDLTDPGPRFWGLVIVVADLAALRDRLHPHLGEIRDAVQPGRQIVTLADSAGLTAKIAFMTPE